MSDTGHISIRQARAQDIPTLIAFRREMFLDMQVTSPERLEASLEPFGKWLDEQMQAGEAQGFLAQGPRGPVGSALGWIYQWYPSPMYPENRKVGYLFNVFVAEGFRRQGLARRLVEDCIGWLKSCGARKITLHTSEKGRSLYASLGFQEGNEMELDLPGG
jgi:ribosomal protein S18 acetylase RimI-like enzyme